MYRGFQENGIFTSIPDIGLATLASILINEGHDVIIKDLVSFEILEELYPHEYKDELINLRNELDAFASKKTPGEIGFDKDESKLISKISKLEEKIEYRNQGVLSRISQDLNHLVNHYQPHLVGFKLWSLPSLPNQLYLARELKRKNKNLTMIGGGYHVDLMHYNQHYDFANAFDFFVYGYGEPVMKRLNDLMTGDKEILKTIPNLIYRDNGKIRVNKRENKEIWLSPLTFDKDVYLGMKSDKDKLKVPFLECSRGCTGTCAYCSGPFFSGRQTKLKPISFLIDELETFHSKYGFSYFYDSALNTPFSHIINAYKEMKKRCRSFALNTYLSLRDFEPDYIPFLKQLHYDTARIGIETGSDKLLMRVNKNRTADDGLKRILMLQESGINCSICLMSPLPGEDESDRLETLSYVEKMNPSLINVHPPEINPATYWWSQEKDINIKNPEQVMGYILENGTITWDIGNKILPVAFREKIIGQDIYYNGRPFKDVFYAHKKFFNRVKKINSHTSGSCTDKYNAELKYKQLARKVEEKISEACENGDFKGAHPLIHDFNQISTCGELY